MGNQQSFEKHIDFKDLKSNYTYEKKYTDSRFGEVKLLKENSTGQKVFQKDFSSTTAKEFEVYNQDIKNTAALNHPNVLKIYGYNSKKEDLFCADFYKLSLFFESFEKDLEQDISKRQKTKDYYPETELWYILDSIASACAYLQNNKIPHRDIRPYNVFITPSKEYKLSPNSLFKPSYNPGYFSNLEGLEEQSLYYSPEQLKFFGLSEEQRAKNPYDEYKSDVFGLGMTMLEAGLLERVPDLYHREKHEVKEQPIKDALNQLRSRYSENFVRTVESAIDFNPETRLDFIRLDRELGVYRRDIREKARGVQPEQNVVSDPDELDRRVRAAVKRSEEIIRRSSPTKSRNKDLDPIIEAYLNSDPRQTSSIHNVAPFITSEPKYDATLNIRTSGFTQNQGQGEVAKRTAYVEPSGTTPRQAGTGTTPRQGLATSQVGAASFGGASQPLSGSQVGGTTPGGRPAAVSGSQVGAGYGAQGSTVGATYGAQGSTVGAGYGTQGSTVSPGFGVQAGLSGSQVGVSAGAGYGAQGSTVGAGYGTQGSTVGAGTTYGAQGSTVGAGAGYGATTGLSSSQVGATGTGYGAQGSTTYGAQGSTVGAGYGTQGSTVGAGAGYGATTGLSSSQVGATGTGYGAQGSTTYGAQGSTVGATYGAQGSTVGAGYGTQGSTVGAGATYGAQGSTVGATGYGTQGSYGTYGTTTYEKQGTSATTGLDNVKKSYTQGEAGLANLGGNYGTTEANYSSTTGNYGVGGTYTTTTYTTTYEKSATVGGGAGDADDLTRRIQEALAQSKTTTY